MCHIITVLTWLGGVCHIITVLTWLGEVCHIMTVLTWLGGVCHTITVLTWLGGVCHIMTVLTWLGGVCHIMTISHLAQRGLFHNYQTNLTSCCMSPILVVRIALGFSSSQGSVKGQQYTNSLCGGWETMDCLM